MNSETENFEQLRRLLALKRHEQPPPGYFDRFSGQVTARIRAGEQGLGAFERTWYYRFWKLIEAQPVFAGAFGAAVCAVLISGIVNSEETSVSSVMGPVNVHAAVAPLAEPTLAAAETGSGPGSIDTNITPSIKSLFDYQLDAQPQLINGSLDLMQNH